MDKEKKPLTFKLSGNELDLTKMKASEASRILQRFFKHIEKVDKEISIKNIKSGSMICDTMMLPSFRERVDIFKEYIEDFLKESTNPVERVGLFDTETNKLIYEVERPEIVKDVNPHVIGFFEGEIKDIGGTEPNINIHIRLDKYEHTIVFPIPLEEKDNAKKWASYLYARVSVYAEVESDILGNIIEGKSIFNVVPLELPDIEKIQQDFDKLVKQLSIPDFTKRILDMRHEDE